MALSEKEFERLIESHLSNELDAYIEVPDINNQWQMIKKQILEGDKLPATKNFFLKHKGIAVAATILIIVGSINFLNPNNANAVGGKIAEFITHMVGKTTRNITTTYKQSNDPGIPTVVDVGDITQKEVTLDQAQASIPNKLAIPSYLPPETTIRRVLLASFATNVAEIFIEYNYKDTVIVFTQQNNAGRTSRGTLYDTDDTVVKDLIVNGSPAMLFLHKNGIATLAWQSRDLILEIKGALSEEEITKIANSIH